MIDAKILILEDEEAISDMVDIILRKEGFSKIESYSTLKTARDIITQHNFDLYILDIMLPDGSGLNLAEEIRKHSDAPIFFLTAKSSDADKIRGFMHGADDYITKPFNPMELAARVKVQTSRYLASRSTARPTFSFGRCQLDVDGAKLLVDGEEMLIPGKQFQLLHFFCQHPNQVLSKEQLFEAVWGMDSFIDDNTIMVHIRRLREKIELDPSKPKLLVTVRGIGYKLQAAGV